MHFVLQLGAGLYRRILSSCSRGLAGGAEEDLLRALRTGWHERLRRRGRLSAVAFLLGELWDLARNLETPRLAPRRGNVEMSTFASDLRLTTRRLMAAPGFTAAVALTLGLGIGANAGIFGVVDAVILRPLPYEQPQRLVRIWPETNFNITMARRVGEGVPAIETISGISLWSYTLTGDGTPEEVQVARVFADHFTVVGVEPFLGRAFTPEEGLPGGGGIVILSHGLWQRRFGSDPDIIGRTIQLDSYETHPSHVVIGVLPPDHRPVTGEPQAWTPFEIDAALAVGDDRSWFVNTVIGRLAGGADAAQAQEQLRRVAAELRAEIPSVLGDEEVTTATVVPLHRSIVGDLPETLWLLQSAVLLVLALACVNSVNLLMARLQGRSREIGVRRALGASRGRVVGEVLGETAVLGVLGGLLGAGLGWAALRLLVAYAPADLPRVHEAAAGPRFMLFALALSALVSLAFGIVPALRASGTGLEEALQGESRGAVGGSGRRSRTLDFSLVLSQVALSVVLVIAAGLMLRSFAALLDVEHGIVEPRGLLALKTSPPEARYPEAAQKIAYYEEVLGRIAAFPGVESGGAIQLLPLTWGNWAFPYYPEGHAVPEGSPPPSANFRVVTRDYFETVGMRVVAGRGLEPADRQGSEAVAVVNEALQENIWPGDSAVGKELRFFGRDSEPVRVVGVVADVRQHTLELAPLPEVYRPFDQYPLASMFVVVRTRGDPAALVAGVQDTIWAVDPEAPISSVRTMDEVVGQSATTERFLAILFGLFAGLALALAAVGVYGVTAYQTSQRLPEFGVRLALGARSSSIRTLALRRGLLPVACGLTVGLAGAAAAGRLLEGLLFGVGARDPVTFVAVGLLLTLTGTVAAYLPALRASRLDPMSTLRRESP